jgi:hypothetical protein
MATYKVIQDIEAEDHILGPLTLRQFIFALIAVFFFYISFLLASKGVIFLDILFFPPGLFFGFFALPFGRDQPTEVWALAKLRFFLKPRRRIWDQSGIKQLVTITVPRKIERQLTDGLSQYEVKSRLKVLADTLDTRGWAIKNSPIPQAYLSNNNDSDRLIDISSFSQPLDNIVDEDDVMDETNSQTARHFAQMINETSRSHHQQLLEQMNSSENSINVNNSSANQWFMPATSNTDDNYQVKEVFAPDVKASNETDVEKVLSSQIKDNLLAQKVGSNNLRTLNPLNGALSANNQTNSQLISNVDDTSTSSLTNSPDPAILSLANSDDLSVQAIANEAKRTRGDSNQEEVVISLH